jgi:GNAT superfamily N-acetyltransferase
MRDFLKSFVRPQNIVYLLVHVILFAAGVMIVFVSESALGQGIGSSLIATAITGWVIFVYILTGQSLRARLEVAERLGLVAGFTKRGAAIRSEYDSRLAKAKREIDILGFGLRSLREDYRGDFAKWKTRANVRILLLSPDFPTSERSLANLRDTEELNTPGQTADEIRQFVDATRDLVDERFQVRLFSCLPSVNIFRTDDEMFWGPYLMGEASRNAPTLVVRSGGDLFESLRKHFDEIWKNKSRAP